MAWAVLAVLALAVLSRGIMGMTWTLTLRSVDQMSTRPPPPVHATRSQRGDRDCSSQGATVGLDGLNLGDPGATVGAIGPESSLSMLWR